MIRVRFAPSPTGHLHIGGLRGAFYNYIFAKQNHGEFIIRIEDTDFERSKEEYVKSIIDSFAWCSMASDEPVAKQSERMDIYKKHIDALILNNKAYWSEEPNAEGIVGKVLKIRCDKSKEYIEFNDLVRGHMKFATTEFDDFIIARSDGSPLYNLVVVIDDYEMNISHVIRGEEHLTNTPRQIIIYEALGAPIPQFAHLPLILGSDGKKLSKRDAATAVIDYKEEGFLPEALCMYLVRLGWAYKDQEYFTFQELLDLFDITKVHSAGAIFDKNKLLSVNHHFLQKKSNEEIIIYCEGHNLPFFKNIADNEINIKKAMTLFKDRSKTLLELHNYCSQLFNLDCHYDLSHPDFHPFKDNFEFIVQQTIALLSSIIYSESLDSIKNTCDAFLKEHQTIPKKDFFSIIRFALTNTINAPSVYGLIDALGIEKTIKKLTHCLHQFKG